MVQEAQPASTLGVRPPILTPTAPAQLVPKIDRTTVAPYTDRQGQRRVLIWGMIENDTTWSADDLLVTVVMRDSRQEPVGTIAGKAVALSLPAGGRVPFRLDGPAPNGWAGYTTNASAIAGDSVMSRLIVADSESLTDSDTGLHVRGVVRNDSAWPTADVRVWATLHDHQGRTMTARWSVVRGVLEPGGTRPFDLGFGVVRSWVTYEVGATDLFE